MSCAGDKPSTDLKWAKGNPFAHIDHAVGTPSGWTIGVRFARLWLQYLRCNGVHRSGGPRLLCGIRVAMILTRRREPVSARSSIERSKMNSLTPMRIVLAVLSGLLVAIAGPEALGQVPRVPAFPGAEGHGSMTRGGREGPVIAVTNLDDSGPSSVSRTRSSWRVR